MENIYDLASKQSESQNSTTSPPEKNTPNKFMKWIPTISYTLLLIVLASIVFSLISRGAVLIKKYIKPPSSPTKPDEVVVELPGKEEDREVYFVKDSQNPTKIYIYIKNTATEGMIRNFEKLVYTVEDAYLSHYHSNEIVYGDLYLIRRVGYDGPEDQDWTDELWVYRRNGSAQKLYSIKNIDFRVSPNARYVTVKENEILKILDISNKDSIKENIFSDLKVEGIDNISLNLQVWSDNSIYFWGDYSFEVNPKSFFKINILNNEVKKYDASKLSIQKEEFSLNQNTGFISYSDFPYFVDPQDLGDYTRKKGNNNLYVYNLENGDPQVLDQSQAKQFRPKWVDQVTVEYNSPVDAGRIRKQIKITQ